MSERPVETDSTAERLGPEAYRAMYDYSPHGVLFTAPDGRVLAANRAACEILGRTEDEICSLGRQGLADYTDERWGPLLTERERTGRVQGVARMIRGDGAHIEVEMSSILFSEANGKKRTCTIMRDVTERARMERELLEMSARLRELTLTDELTGLRNRRGFVAVGAQLLELADRQGSTAALVYLDVDNLKALNDLDGHGTGDAALRAVAGALSEVLRRADTVARIGGDEFVALALGSGEPDQEKIEQRIEDYLAGAQVLTAVGRSVKVSMGWAIRAPDESKTIEDLVVEADHAMYRAKATKRRMPSRGRSTLRH